MTRRAEGSTLSGEVEAVAMPAGQRARAAWWAARRSRASSVPDLLDGQVGLDLECLDRVYLNGYVPNLQVGGQVVTFLTRHLGNPIPSPALFNRIGERFRAAVSAFAGREHIRWSGSAGTTARSA